MAAKNFAHISFIFVAIFVVQGTMAAGGAASRNAAIANYVRPLSFEPNLGQTDKRVDFLAHGDGYGLFFSHAEAVIVLRPGGAKPGSRVAGTTVLLRPVDANASAAAMGLEKEPSRSNYFIGNVPKNWHTRIPNYAKVRYSSVYPGINMIYYGNQRQLEYDFVVSPGADPNRISLEFRGPTKAELDSNGGIVMRTDAGDLRWRQPIAYQDVNGRQKLVQCTYVRKGEHLAFSVDTYDRAKPLIIDPVLDYSTYLGGSGGDGANAIAVDAYRNAYVTGFAYSDDFPIKNAFQSTNFGGELVGSGEGNAFVTKFDAAGNLVYSTFLGGFGSNDLEGDEGTGIAVDLEGHAYVAGITSSSDFPIKNAFQSSNVAAFNAFVTKLSIAGDSLVYSTYLGGSGGNFDVCDVHCGDRANAIAVDKRGYAYVTGFTESLDFPTKNPFQATNNAGVVGNISNAFVTKLCPDGNALIYSTYLGGSVYEEGNGIAVDTYGNAYVTGSTGSLDFPTQNAFQNKNNNKTCSQQFGDGCNAFVTKFNAAGNTLVYSTYLGGSGSLCDAFDFCSGDSGNSIALDDSGHAYVAGMTYSGDFPTKDAFQNKLRSPFGNAFVTEFDIDGKALIYSTYLGGCGNRAEKLGDEAYGIAVDKLGAAYITGYTTSTDFPIKDAFQQEHKSPFGNAFVTQLDPTGKALVYSSYLGGSGGSCESPGFNCFPSDSGNGIAVDESGNAYVTGGTNATNFPTKNAFQPMYGGPFAFENAFVTKISAVSGLRLGL